MTVKLATINLEVADPQRSKRFYIDGLGMIENLARSHAPGFVYLESSGASVTLAATTRASVAAEPSHTMELGFEVDDLPALRREFAKFDIAGFEPQSMGWGDVIEGHDYDGHRVIVYCFSAETRGETAR